MKKLLALTPVLLLMLANTAAAGELTVEGEAKAEFVYQKNTNEDFEKGGYRFTNILNLSYAFDKHLSAYARIAAQTANIKHDFYTPKENGTADTKVALDNYGLIYKNSGVTYNLGQQSFALGDQGLMFDNTGFIGREMAGVQALKVDAEVGKTQLMAFHGQLSKSAASQDKSLKLSGLSVKAPLGKDSNVGLTYAHSSHEVFGSKNHYALDLEHNIGKLSLQLEGLRSSAKDDNKGYAFTVGYKPTEKDYFAVSLHRTEANADIAGMTAFENDQRGLRYQYSRKLNNNFKVGLEYMDNSYISQKGNYRSFLTTLSYTY